LLRVDSRKGSIIRILLDFEITISSFNGLGKEEQQVTACGGKEEIGNW
jgi:hypothetical protein